MCAPDTTVQHKVSGSLESPEPFPQCPTRGVSIFSTFCMRLRKVRRIHQSQVEREAASNMTGLGSAVVVLYAPAIPQIHRRAEYGAHSHWLGGTLPE